MSGGAWFAIVYFGIGYAVALLSWARITEEEDTSGWRWVDYATWWLPMASVPGFIMAALWPAELDSIFTRGEGRHRR